MNICYQINERIQTKLKNGDVDEDFRLVRETDSQESIRDYLLKVQAPYMFEVVAYDLDDRDYQGIPEKLWDCGGHYYLEEGEPV